ncbi:MAG: hypothetical protein R3D63_13150 [Paracoccaceae bacterium]
MPGRRPAAGLDAAPQVLALGGQMKAAICLLKNGQALLGHHLGDLDDALCAEEFAKAVADYSALFDHRPALVAVDAHPGHRATQAGRAMGLPVTGGWVWHHHAHLAACPPRTAGRWTGARWRDRAGRHRAGSGWHDMGRRGVAGRLPWFWRRAWLKPAPLPGGDRAAREPWRNALVRLDQAGMSDWADRLFPDKPRDLARQAVAKGINAPMSSSAGRLFDAVAAILGICPDGQSYEGEAAMRLEALAARSLDPAEYPCATDGEAFDPRPMLEAWQADVLAGRPAADMALRFHRFLAAAVADCAKVWINLGEAQAVALSGGVSRMRCLPVWCRTSCGMCRYWSIASPANDGGLALGQAVVAAARALDGAESG